MKFVIVAPHADDEIIGCFELLKEGHVARVLFHDDKALTEAATSSEHFLFGRMLFEDNDFDKPGYTYLFPDPIHEVHPLHRKYGHLGEELLRGGARVIFYSVTMYAPYIHEVANPKQKQAALDLLYPNKKQLWEFEHKFFLFEGYNQWIIKWEDLY